MSTLDLALQIAVKAHSGQQDLDGEAYILHPLQVGLMGNTDEERCTGFLHDVLEDSRYSAEDLIEAGIPEGVVNALRLLTHDKAVSYKEYIERIIQSHNPIALRVKYNDLRHNYSRGKAYPHLQKKHGEALKMVEEAIDKMNSTAVFTPHEGHDTAVFAAGCFWGVQHHFQRMQGVRQTLVGYTGGKEENPTYEQVRSHKTSHVEAILVEYDPQKVSYRDLCKLFFEIHDPSQTDGQGPDIGQQYRSAVFYKNNEEQQIINELKKHLEAQGLAVNTLIMPMEKFWAAEEYHQHYYAQTGGSPYCHVRVKRFK